jgi:copper chaperone
MTQEAESPDARSKWTVNGRKVVVVLLAWSLVIAVGIAAYAYAFGPQLKAAGDLASAEIAVFAVEGMHCSGCADSITQELSKAEGVVSVETSFESGEAVVKYVPRTTTRLQLRQRIGSLGYSATTKEFRKQ